MLKKIGTLVIVAAFVLMLVRPLSASAVTAPDIWVENYSGILDLTTMQYYYENLSPGQQDICNYLVGMSNYMYLDARGFSFSDDAMGSQNSFIAKMISIGSRILYMDSGLSGWGSRFNPYLQNYVSACINYAYTREENINFYDWYDDLDESFVLPYSGELLDAWNVWYEDNSIEGIQMFGDIVSTWHSGEYFNFAFGNYPWYSQSDANRYNDFILNNNPVLYGHSMPYGESLGQMIIGSLTVVPDTLYVLRNPSGNYQYSRFGINENGTLRLLNNNDRYSSCLVYFYQNKLISSTGTGNLFRTAIINYGSAASLRELISYSFMLTPIAYNPVNNGKTLSFQEGYPMITHVYLVDDLNTLSNPEELENIDDLGVDDGNNFIEKPISPYWWVFKHIDDTFPYPVDPVKDNLIDDNGDPVTDPPMNTSIVNNNVVNNYYVTNGEPISVPVNWFSRAESYVSYLWSMTEPLVLYARDLLDCMVFYNDGILSNVKGPGPAIFGICVIGVAGGIVSKLLL